MRRAGAIGRCGAGALKCFDGSADKASLRKHRVGLLMLITAVGLLATAPLTAHARGRTTWIVRDGFYAGMSSGPGALTFFHVKNHRVYHLRFSLNLTCHDSTTGQDTTVNYSAGSAMPQGLQIPADGVLWIRWSQEDSGRMGHITADLRFHHRPLASFSVLSAGGVETCNGFSAVSVHRAPRTPPVPSAP
jgi:hypothetical protein